jgi:membrane-associated phospholipid phosphatase
MHRTSLVVLAGVCAAALAAQADEITDWTQIFLNASVTAGTAPSTLTRSGAIFHAAIFDAVNGINPKFSSIHVNPAAAPGADVRAAAVMAAYTALVHIYPTQKATVFDPALLQSLNAIASGSALEHSVSIQRGMEWGASVADQIWAWRATDGFNTVLPPYLGGGGIGKWIPTPPAFAPGATPQLATTATWVLSTQSQFRPGPPPALTSTTYTADFNETKSLGSATSVTRTADQTLYAKFWQGSTVNWFWERVAITLAAQRHATLQENARTLALLAIAMADATISTWDAKYTYSFWRPITAIQNAAADGNPMTDPDPAWNSLLPVPAHPEYPSAHSTLSGAAVAVLANIFGENVSYTVDSSSLAGVTRSFDSFSAGLAEVKNARIAAGFHFRNSCDVGGAQGEAVGTYVLEHALTSLNGVRTGQVTH